MNKFLRSGAKKLHQFKSFARRRPLIAVGAGLIFFLALMILGSFLRKPRVGPAAMPQPLPVTAYSIGQSPRVTLLARASKAGVIDIVAQTGGVIGKINVSEGDPVGRGQTLLSINTTYGGGNIFSLQRQISQKQKDNTEASYPDQLRAIELQRQQAEDTATSAEEMREINAQAVEGNRSLVSLNETIVNTLNTQLNQYTATNSGGINDDAILTTRQLLSQFQSALASLQANLRTNEYQTDPDKIPANQPEKIKEITLANLRVSEKTLALNKEVAELQYRVALLSERLAFPAAPVSGRVERVHVLPHQLINPGQVLMTITSDEAAPVSLEAFTPRSLAQAVSSLEPSLLIFDNQTHELYPQFVSTEAVEGTLYLVKFLAPATAQISQGQTLEIAVPLAAAATSASIPFVPLDSVYQSQTQAYVFVIESNQARVRAVELGPVSGSFVEVKSGLNSGDQVITSRNVISGQAVKVR